MVARHPLSIAAGFPVAQTIRAVTLERSQNPTPDEVTVTRNTPHLLPAALAVALLALSLFTGGCNPAREYRAALVLSDIAAGTAPSRLKRIAPEPKLSVVHLPAGGRTVEGDLYLSYPDPSAGVLLLPGAAEKGRYDPRLRAFARSLARAGFAVLVPDLEGFRSLKVSSSDITGTADAFSWLLGRPELAPGGRAGMLSFSYASGPALLAALDPRLAGRVRFIMAVGGYYNLRQVLTFFTTGYYLEDGRWRYMAPNIYGKWIFVQSNIARLSDPGDRRIFERLAELKLADPDAPPGDLPDRLTPEGKSLYDFIQNREPGLAPVLLDRLPAAIRREIRLLDPAQYDLSGLAIRFVLVHGYDDDIIPYTQSEALARNLPEGKAQLYLVHGLQHVNLEPGLTDKFRLWRAVSALLGEKERDRPGREARPGREGTRRHGERHL